MKIANPKKSLLLRKANKSYWLYALGEISLIIIGILAAFQVDNWREEVAIEKRVVGNFSLIENDLTEQLTEVEAQVQFELDILHNCEKLIDQYNRNNGFIFDEQYSESLGNINNWRTFIKIDPAYQQLLATGDVGLISNQQIKQRIFSYYHLLQKVETIITENHEYIKESFNPFVLTVSNHSLPNFQSDLYKRIVELGYVPADIGKVLSDNSGSEKTIQEKINNNNVKLELYNSIKMRYRISAVHLSYLENLRSRTQLLLTEIHSIKK